MVRLPRDDRLGRVVHVRRRDGVARSMRDVRPTSSKRTVTFAVDWLVPILLVLLVPVGAIWYTSEHNSKLRQYRASVAACERGNLLRVRINTKFYVYDQAFAESAKALGNATTAVGRKLHDVLGAAAAAAPDQLPLTDCATAFDKPEWFWR